MPPVSATQRPHPAPLPAQGFVRLPAVLAVFPVGKSTWWAGVKSGRFPRPVKLGARMSAWRVEDIRVLLAAHGVGDAVEDADRAPHVKRGTGCDTP